jgi:hypothetical protein
MVGNPGANTLASYVGTLNVIVTYENRGLPSSSALESSTMGLSRNNFVLMA